MFAELLTNWNLFHCEAELNEWKLGRIFAVDRCCFYMGYNTWILTSARKPCWLYTATLCRLFLIFATSIFLYFFQLNITGFKHWGEWWLLKYTQSDEVKQWVVKLFRIIPTFLLSHTKIYIKNKGTNEKNEES